MWLFYNPRLNATNPYPTIEPALGNRILRDKPLNTNSRDKSLAYSHF